MSTSFIIVLIVAVIGLATIPLITRGLHTLFKDYMEYEKHKEYKKTKADVAETKDKLKDVTDKGSLSELIETAKELGEAKK